jgi:hypothetical protein
VRVRGGRSLFHLRLLTPPTSIHVCTCEWLETLRSASLGMPLHHIAKHHWSRCSYSSLLITMAADPQSLLAQLKTHVDNGDVDSGLSTLSKIKVSKRERERERGLRGAPRDKIVCATRN